MSCVTRGSHDWGSDVEVEMQAEYAYVYQLCDGVSDHPSPHDEEQCEALRTADYLLEEVRMASGFFNGDMESLWTTVEHENEPQLFEAILNGLEDSLHDEIVVHGLHGEFPETITATGEVNGRGCEATWRLDGTSVHY